MRGRQDPVRVEALAVRALVSGGERRGSSLRSVEWDISDRCENPVFVAVSSAPVDELVPKRRRHAAVFVDLWTRCRRCGPCLRMRARLWAARAMSEIERSSRTWLVTLTLRPEEQYRALIRGRAASGATDADEFMTRHEVISKDITLYLKRVRKVSGARLRYLLVAEAHKSGLPHYHMLVHETWGSRVTWEQLASQWGLGYAQAVLVKDGAMYKSVRFEHGHRQWRWTDDPQARRKVAAYVAKYLAKSVLARVRASQRYGD